MKIGDLVRWGDTTCGEQWGIIIGGPREGCQGNNQTRRYEVVWYTTKTETTGWWNESYLEVMNESR